MLARNILPAPARAENHAENHMVIQFAHGEFRIPLASANVTTFA